MALQDHIHLDTTKTGSPEYSPTRKWKVMDRLDIPEVNVSLDRGLTGKLHLNILQDTNGPVQFQNYRFTIKVEPDDTYTLEQNMAALKAMNGKIVYFVDSFHANDSADHSSDVREMALQVGEFPMSHGPGLIKFHVDIDLIDADTVA